MYSESFGEGSVSDVSFFGRVSRRMINHSIHHCSHREAVVSVYCIFAITLVWYHVWNGCCSILKRLVPTCSPVMVVGLRACFSHPQCTLHILPSSCQLLWSLARRRTRAGVYQDPRMFVLENLSCSLQKFNVCFLFSVNFFKIGTSRRHLDPLGKL